MKILSTTTGYKYQNLEYGNSTEQITRFNNWQGKVKGGWNCDRLKETYQLNMVYIFLRYWFKQTNCIKTIMSYPGKFESWLAIWWYWASLLKFFRHNNGIVVLFKKKKESPCLLESYMKLVDNEVIWCLRFALK